MFRHIRNPVVHGEGSAPPLQLNRRQTNIIIESACPGLRSNFIGVLSFLHAIRAGRLRDYVTAAGGAERELHFGSKTTRQIHLFLSFRDGRNQYELGLSPTGDDGLFPSPRSYPLVIRSTTRTMIAPCRHSARGGNRDQRSGGIGRPVGSEFQEIRNQFLTPEEIDDSPVTAPSKRVEALVPGYQKPYWKSG